MCKGFITLPDVESKIALYGWAITAVHESGHDFPTFAYTTGLTDKGLPELLVYGLPVHVAGALLNDLASDLADGVPLCAGLTIHTADGDVPDIYVVDVVDTSDMRVTDAMYPQFSALQLVWADIYGALPWEPRYSMCRHHQPLKGVAWV